MFELNKMSEVVKWEHEKMPLMIFFFQFLLKDLKHWTLCFLFLTVLGFSMLYWVVVS